MVMNHQQKCAEVEVEDLKLIKRMMMEKKQHYYSLIDDDACLKHEADREESKLCYTMRRSPAEVTLFSLVAFW